MTGGLRYELILIIEEKEVALNEYNNVEPR